MKHTKTLRRGLGILLALMLCLTLLPATALAETGIAIDEENFPDDYFRQYVSDEFDSDNDGKLSADEIKAATEIDVYDEFVIESLTGIEYFTNLEYLDCAGNKLTTLDISHNTKVELLDCDNNNLTELKIGQNTSLTDLYCSDNQLTSLDVSKNTGLTNLQCSDNQLTSLDVSMLTSLVRLYCYDNYLTELKLQNNKALEYLECDENELTSLDVSQNTALVGLNCSGNYLTSLNISKNTALESLECYENELTELNVDNNTALESLACYENELTELNVDNNTALKYLECSYNRLEELDVSYNTALVELFCTNNYLTELKFGSNPALQRLRCGDNILTSLEFGNNTNLSQVDCENNKLTSLDLSKNSVYYLTADNNIYDITVDADRQFALSTLSEGKFDVSKAEILSGGNVDQDGILTVTPGVTEVTYTYDCGNGNYPTFTLTVSEAGDVDGIVIDENSFPDANFRNFVSKKIDNGDGVLSSQEIARTTSVNCSYKDIADLTGIEHFTALEDLDCYDNYLTELKLQNNKALEYLECYENELTSLDVSQNTALVGLNCSDNYLTSLDVSQNTALEYLHCSYNELTSLDLSNNKALEDLYCHDNYLTELKLQNNKALEYLHCSYNELTSLDLSNNTSLWALNCDDNSYDITTTNGTFDLSTLPGFAAKKASAWTGGTVKGNILTVNEGVTKVTYTYNCGNEKSAVFTLNIVGNTSTYTITVESAKNGTITASPKSAAKDDTVTLTVTPDKGYTLEIITVTDKNGDKVKLTEKSGKYTFTMPVSKVTVKATFAEVVTEPDNPFVDLADDTYYYDAVLWAAEEGITGGVDDTHFAPKATCTRAQAVTFLWRAAGSPAPKSSIMPFTDVKAGSYYYDAVLWAVENGITKGTSDTTFSRDVTCSRAQIVTFLWRSQEAPAAGAVNPFTDVKADAYYAEAVLWAVKEDVTKGTTDTTFSPKADCTRAQIVTFIWRALAE